MPEKFSDIKSESFYPDDSSQKIKESCNKVYFSVKSILQSDNFNFALTVVKVMEIVENLKKIKGYDKKKVAIYCIKKLINETNVISEKAKENLIITVPMTIESIIKLSKGKPINEELKNTTIVQSIDVKNRAIRKMVKHIEEKQYNLQTILENVFAILTQIMYIVGSYPSLSGEKRKEIAIDVITTLITKYKERKTGNKVPNHFMYSVLDAVPTMIDTFILVNKGEFDINVSGSCLSGCFPCS